MIKINLLSEGKPAASRRRTTASEGGGFNLVLLVAGLALGLLFAGWRYLDLNGEINGINEEIDKNKREVARLQDVLKQVAEYEAKKADLENKIKLIEDLKRNQRGPVRLMDEISTALPDLVWLNSMQMIGGTITLRGQALNPNAVANFLENLGRSPYFAEPNLQDTVRGPNTYSFTITVGFTFTPRGQQPAGAPAAADATPAKKSS